MGRVYRDLAGAAQEKQNAPNRGVLRRTGLWGYSTLTMHSTGQTETQWGES
jgi:hypothetical protein